MASFLSEPVTIFPIKPNRTLGGITAYITMSESANDKLTVTKQPVQQGAMISDHAYKEPSELTVNIVAGVNLGTPLDELYKEFLTLQSDRVKFDVVTGKRNYSNMLLVGIGQTTDKTTENILSLSLTLLEIITVEVTPTKVPPRGRQAGPGKTGATEKAGKKSALKVLKEGIGNLFGGG
jgi:hypothetical protein